MMCYSTHSTRTHTETHTHQGELLHVVILVFTEVNVRGSEEL